LSKDCAAEIKSAEIKTCEKLEKPQNLEPAEKTTYTVYHHTQNRQMLYVSEKYLSIYQNVGRFAFVVSIFATRYVVFQKREPILVKDLLENQVPILNKQSCNQLTNIIEFLLFKALEIT
jgi:hypothetical protein